MKANYFKVGVFLVLATALIVAAVVILGAGTFAPKGEYFETYFDRSVGGLSPGSPVELQGVKVGQVKNIGFASETYDIPPDLATRLGEQRLIRVVFAVDPRFVRELSAGERQARRGREIRSGLRIRLESNLITGQSYLQGTYVDPNRFPVQQWPWEPKFSFVPSVPGQFATLKDSLDRILTELDQLDVQKVFNHVDDLLLTANRAVQDANVAVLHEQVSGLLADTRDKVRAVDTAKIGQQVETALAALDRAIVDANVPGLTQEVRALFAEARVTNSHLQGLLARPDRDKELANIAMVVDQLNTTLRRLDLLVATQTPRIEGTLENFRKISSDLKELSESLKRTPSDLLFSAPPRKSELMK
jgi:phospholipid/cholesterol/gamma-HCH transport system substrate-binding protein